MRLRDPTTPTCPPPTTQAGAEAELDAVAATAKPLKSAAAPHKLMPQWCAPTTDLPDKEYTAYAARKASAKKVDMLAQGAQLLPGTALTSQNGKYQLVMQPNGNGVVEMLSGFEVRWRSEPLLFRPSRFVMLVLLFFFFLYVLDCQQTRTSRNIASNFK